MSGVVQPGMDSEFVATDTEVLVSIISATVRLETGDVTDTRELSGTSTVVEAQPASIPAKTVGRAVPKKNRIIFMVRIVLLLLTSGGW
jgi:hypothetical protein